MTRTDIVFMLIGSIATIIIMNVFNAVSGCTYNGRGAKEWYNEESHISSKYIKLYSCAKSYQQCGYIVDDCVKENK